MDDLIKINKQLESLYKIYGIIGLIFGAILIFSIFFLFKYLTKKIEKSAEANQEKWLHEFKAMIDRDMELQKIRYSSAYIARTDAIREVYKSFFVLLNLIRSIDNADKYGEILDPKEGFDKLITIRRHFIDVYGQNKIYIPIAICNEIDGLFPVIDRYLDILGKGIAVAGSINFAEWGGEEVKVLSVLPSDENDAIIENFTSVSNALENLFRKFNEE